MGYLLQGELGMQIITQGVKPQGSQNADVERVKLCDVDAVDPTIINGEFYRHFVYSADGTSIVSSFDTDLSGTGYVILGVAMECPENMTDELGVIHEILCDNLANGTKPVEIRRTLVYNKTTGAEVSIGFQNLDGTAYTVAGTVERCNDKKPEEVITGSESITVIEDVAGALTVPANTQYAIIQNISDGPIFFRKDGTVITDPSGAEGFRLDSCGSIKLGCDPQSGGSITELANFSVLAGEAVTGRIQVCYFGCS